MSTRYRITAVEARESNGSKTYHWRNLTRWIAGNQAAAVTTRKAAQP